MNIVALDSYTMNPGDLSWSELEALGTLQIYARSNQNEIVARAKEADIIITNKIVFDQNILDQLPKLKYICISATGYNTIDIAYAKSRNILVSNVSGYAAESAAEHVFAMLFKIYRTVAEYDQKVKAGRWSEAQDFCFFDSPITSLAGKRFGILGFGMIGRQVAKIAHAFDMNVLVHHKYSLEADSKYQAVDLENLFSESDILSLHAPLNDSTQDIINVENLAKMKSDSILINTARGGLVDESALYNCLKQNKIRAAALDVLNTEPPTERSPLFGLDNCVITPHQAWGSVYARQKLMDDLVSNIKAFQNNNPRNLVS